MNGLKVKTVALTSRNPRIIDETIQNAIPENATVTNYIFSNTNGNSYCHIIYYEFAKYADRVKINEEWGKA